MDQILEFIGNNLFLTTAFLVVAAMLTYNIYADIAAGANIGPREVTDLINREEATLIDVRPISDFNKGHILGAKNIPMSGLMKQLGTLEKHKDQPVIINCRSGAQSALACKQLRSKGFEKVYNLRGGILAWQSAGMPISKK